MHIFYIQGTNKGCIMYSFEQAFIPKINIKKYNCTSTQLMKRLCEGFQTDFEGNRKTVRKNHKYIQKTPLLLSKDFQLFFPTCSHKEEDCCWINFYNVSKIERCNELNLLINFNFQSFHPKNQFTTLIEVPCNRRTFLKQMKRCEEIDEFYQRNDILVEF